MIIPATPNELSNLDSLADKLLATLYPFMGMINVRIGDKVYSGTGLVVNVPNAPGGAIVLTAAHVAEPSDALPSPAYPTGRYADHRIVLPTEPATPDGSFLASNCPLVVHSIHADLDLATLLFTDFQPTHKWERSRIKKPPQKSGHSFGTGFPGRAVKWEDAANLSLGAVIFLLKTISEGGDETHLQFDATHKRRDYQGMSGGPVWQFAPHPEGVAPQLSGLIIGGDPESVIVHSAHDLRDDGSWLKSRPSRLPLRI